jgi:glutamyl-tRNA reductase
MQLIKALHTQLGSSPGTPSINVSVFIFYERVRSEEEKKSKKKKKKKKKKKIFKNPLNSVIKTALHTCISLLKELFDSSDGATSVNASAGLQTCQTRSAALSQQPIHC